MGCPQDITDRLGGWAINSVGEEYGSGYPIEVLYKWVDKALSQILLVNTPTALFSDPLEINRLT